jgi:hypothetical protein
MIYKKEEKFQHVFDSFKDQKTEQSMFNKFLETYPEDWKLLKTTFSKFKRSKHFGSSIPLMQPEQALRKELRIWLQNKK